MVKQPDEDLYIILGLDLSNKKLTKIPLWVSKCKSLT